MTLRCRSRVAPKLGVASPHRVGGFQQVVTEIAIAGLDELGVLSFKITGLVLCPDKAGVLGNGCLGIKAADIANFSDDTGRIYLANSGDRSKRIWDDLELLFNGFVQNFDLLLQSPHGGNRYCHSLVYGVVHGNWQTVRVSSSDPNGLCLGCRISEVSALFINEGS